MNDPFGLSEDKMPAAEPPKTGEDSWTGYLFHVDIERGKAKTGLRAGIPYVFYRLAGTDGRMFCTYSRTFGETAHKALLAPHQVEIQSKPGLPCPTITGIRALEQEEEDADAP